MSLSDYTIMLWTGCSEALNNTFVTIIIPSLVFPPMRWLQFTTTVQRRFDGRSTGYQRSLRSLWRNTSVAADPQAAVTLTY